MIIVLNEKITLKTFLNNFITEQNVEKYHLN